GSAWDIDGSRLYRTDCSGLVDNAWHLNSDPDTDALGSGSYSTPIAGSDLKPGDILDYLDGDHAQHHVILFEAWESDHVHFSYLSFGSTPMREGTHATLANGDGSGYLSGHPAGGYRPYRYLKIQEDGPLPPPLPGGRAVVHGDWLSVFTVGAADGHVQESYLSLSGGGWYTHDLTTVAGTPASAAQPVAVVHGDWLSVFTVDAA